MSRNSIYLERDELTMKHSLALGLVVVMAVAAVLGQWARADMEKITPTYDPKKALPDVPRITKLGKIGLLEDFQFQADGQRRDARIYIPKNYSPEKPIGVLFGFHGYMGKLGPAPVLTNLWDMETHADTEYVIAVTLAIRYRADEKGWHWGWNHGHDGLRNVDAQAVHDLLKTVKDTYRIDENRIFGYGHSNGAGFCSGITYNLPGVFAAMAPKNPVMGTYEPEKNNPFAMIALGGTTDQFGTADTVRKMNARIAEAPNEGDFYVYGIGHNPAVPDDDNVLPALNYNQKIWEFFREHPLNYQYYGFVPEYSGQEFAEDFKKATRLSSKHWRMETFDDTGVLGDQAGYRFVAKDGELVSQAFKAAPDPRNRRITGMTTRVLSDGSQERTTQYSDGSSEITKITTQTRAEQRPSLVRSLFGVKSHAQSVTVETPLKVIPPTEAAGGKVGGLCRTLFYKEGHVKFSVDFKVNSLGTARQVVPLWVSDTRGWVHALELDGSEVRWRTYATHQKFRAGIVAAYKEEDGTCDDFVPADVYLSFQKPFKAELGKAYRATLEREGAQFKWTLAKAGSDERLAEGEFKLRDPESYQFGMGLVADGADVAFDNVALKKLKPVTAEAEPVPAEKP
jgi:poly(3-hydroxybutyrate) depolymerase